MSKEIPRQLWDGKVHYHRLVTKELAYPIFVSSLNAMHLIISYILLSILLLSFSVCHVVPNGVLPLRSPIQIFNMFVTLHTDTKCSVMRVK